MLSLYDVNVKVEVHNSQGMHNKSSRAQYFDIRFLANSHFDCSILMNTLYRALSCAQALRANEQNKDKKYTLFAFRFTRDV